MSLIANQASRLGLNQNWRTPSQPIALLDTTSVACQEILLQFIKKKYNQETTEEAGHQFVHRPKQPQKVMVVP